MDVEAEKARISKELEKIDKVIAGTENRLKNKAFIDKAPADVIDGARQQLQANKDKREELAGLLSALG